MKVLITGAAGRLGSETCRKFVAANLNFRATDRRAPDNLPYHIEIADIRVAEACSALVQGCDAVVHFANHPNSNAGDAQTVFNENCSMNMNVFQAAAEVGIKRIVFASSIQAISGARKFDDSLDEQKRSSLTYLPLDGNVPANPGNPYAASKVAGEMLLQYFCKFHGLSGVALRFPMLVPRNSVSLWRGDADRLARGLNLDEAFTLLSFPDAAQLIVAALRSSIDGYRTYFPTARAPWLDMPVQEIIQRYFPGVPLRKPVEQLQGLVDLSEIQRDTGWMPEDEPRPL